jgi:hypothetical protein
MVSDGEHPRPALFGMSRTTLPQKVPGMGSHQIMLLCPNLTLLCAGALLLAVPRFLSVIVSHAAYLLVHFCRDLRCHAGAVLPMAHGRSAGQVSAIQEDALAQHMDRLGGECRIPPLIRPDRLRIFLGPHG